MQRIQAWLRDMERVRLTSGTYLPSSRQLARILGVNRKTVVFADEDLIAQGWLDSAGTRGTMVAASLPDPVNRHQGEAEATMSDEVIDYRFALPPERPTALPTGPGPTVDEGAPDGRLVPVELLAPAYRVEVPRASHHHGSNLTAAPAPPSPRRPPKV